jgi:hypothetical protein
MSHKFAKQNGFKPAGTPHKRNGREAKERRQMGALERLSNSTANERIVTEIFNLERKGIKL